MTAWAAPHVGPHRGTARRTGDVRLGHGGPHRARSAARRESVGAFRGAAPPRLGAGAGRAGAPWPMGRGAGSGAAGAAGAQPISSKALPFVSGTHLRMNGIESAAKTV